MDFLMDLANLSCTPLLVISSGGRAAEQTIAHFNVVPLPPAMHIHDEPMPGSDTGVRQGWGVLVGVCHVSRPANFLIKVPYSVLSCISLAWLKWSDADTHNVRVNWGGALSPPPRTCLESLISSKYIRQSVPAYSKLVWTRASRIYSKTQAPTQRVINVEMLYEVFPHHFYC